MADEALPVEWVEVAQQAIDVWDTGLYMCDGTSDMGKMYVMFNPQDNGAGIDITISNGLQGWSGVMTAEGFAECCILYAGGNDEIPAAIRDDVLRLINGSSELTRAILDESLPHETYIRWYKTAHGVSKPVGSLRVYRDEDSAGIIRRNLARLASQVARLSATRQQLIDDQKQMVNDEANYKKICDTLQEEANEYRKCIQSEMLIQLNDAKLACHKRLDGDGDMDISVNIDSRMVSAVNSTTTGRNPPLRSLSSGKEDRDSQEIGKQTGDLDSDSDGYL